MHLLLNYIRHTETRFKFSEVREDKTKLTVPCRKTIIRGSQSVCRCYCECLACACVCVMSEIFEITWTKDLSRIVIRFGSKSSAAPRVQLLNLHGVSDAFAVTRRTRSREHTGDGASGHMDCLNKIITTIHLYTTKQAIK